MGGVSDERSVSIATGKVIKAYLDKGKYSVRQVLMDKPGLWRKKITPANTDLVFNALHGAVGEDGQMQGYLDVVRIPYTGSGVLASALGMDKFTSRQLFMAAGLDVPASMLLTSEPEDYDKIELPAVVKPNQGGSSLGVIFVLTREELVRAVRKSLASYGSALIEQVISGREVTVPVLGNTKAEALPVVEIIPQGSSFFDYKNKYQKNGAEEIVPADIADVVKQNLQNCALKAHEVLDCRGYSRTDMILMADNRIKILETNTLPGLTQTSLLPKSAAAAGITFPELLDKVITFALNEH